MFSLWAMKSLLQLLNSATAAPGAVTDTLCVMDMAVSQSDFIYKSRHWAGFRQWAGVCQLLIYKSSSEVPSPHRWVPQGWDDSLNVSFKEKENGRRQQSVVHRNPETLEAVSQLC